MRLLVIVILIYTQQALGQSDTLNITITEIPLRGDESSEYVKACEEEKQRAIQDIQAGVMKVENYIGLTFKEIDFDFEEFYFRYLISKYKIESEVTGCTSSPSRNCYFDEMNKAIYKEHGLSNDDLENAAKEEYKQFMLLDNEGKRKYIDFDYVYSRVDERASYKADTKHLQDRVRAKVDFKKIDFSKYPLKGFHAEVVIDEMGNVVSCKVVSRNFPFEASEVIQKAVKEIGGWTPALLYGLPVKSRTSFDFLF